MSKKKKETPRKGIENVEQTLTRTEQFLEQNYKPLLYVLAGAVLLVGIAWLLRMYISKKNEEALSQMYMAEQYFGQDSLRLALNGDGNNLGFIDIAKEYRSTRSGKLANFYAGACLMHLGQYEEAIGYLTKYKQNDEVIAPQAKGLIGDAHVELGDMAAGIKNYLEAADMAENAFLTPIYLMKAGMLYENEGKWSDALKLYERVQDKYPESNEGRSIDKYIARVKLHIN
ncbi:MAG TPA: tetratricopeptide repeat protein [Bacteroidales bacterium]|jgi:tetratricopeptide (TPR) repeat protein|nr:tetratricopeptide repeat protein [Bacteroidales bacterium]MDI9532635.1 tetratricopeptide repeat protein [Bacteroidota bacterium]OPZ57067.1 MAG: Tetratricopeptide repeat protein [Bacteroidetes bacterium ADurb.BinA012]MBK7731625.1 tetratricopeptide repeat protein [Bacteroidales bacterium]MBP7035765.1 tetratricopeptide repeat protein [Bacteroidales bacterium]